MYCVCFRGVVLEACFTQSIVFVCVLEGILQ